MCARLSGRAERSSHRRAQLVDEHMAMSKQAMDFSVAFKPRGTTIWHCKLPQTSGRKTIPDLAGRAPSSPTTGFLMPPVTEHSIQIVEEFSRRGEANFVVSLYRCSQCQEQAPANGASANIRFSLSSSARAGIITWMLEQASRNLLHYRYRGANFPHLSVTPVCCGGVLSRVCMQ